MEADSWLASFNMRMPSVFLVVSLSSVTVSVTLSFRDIKLCLRTPKSEHPQALLRNLLPITTHQGPLGKGQDSRFGNLLTEP